MLAVHITSLVEARDVDTVACDDFIDYVRTQLAGTPSADHHQLTSELCSPGMMHTLQDGLRHADDRAAATVRRFITVLVENYAHTSTDMLSTLTGVPCSTCDNNNNYSGRKRMRQKRSRSTELQQRPPSSTLLIAAMRYNANESACIRLASLELAHAVMQHLISDEADSAVASALPTDAVLAALDDESLLVARTARELLCTMLERGGDDSVRGAHLLDAVHGWLNLRLPPSSGSIDAKPPRHEQQPEALPAYLLDRVVANSCPDGGSSAAADVSHATAHRLGSPEPALALAIALFDRAHPVGAVEDVDDGSTMPGPLSALLRSGSVLSRCVALIPNIFRLDDNPRAGQRVLALISTVCRSGHASCAAQLLPPSADCLTKPSTCVAPPPVATSSGDVGSALAHLTSVAESLLHSDAPIAAMRLAAACAPARSAAVASPLAGCELPPPVPLVVRTARVSAHSIGLGGALAAVSPSDTSLRAALGSRARGALMHAMRAATAWHGTAWDCALLADGWPELTGQLIEDLAASGSQPAVASSHFANDAALLCTAADSLGTLLSSACVPQPGAAAVATAAQAIGSLCNALAACVGTAAAPLEGKGTRRLGCGAPCALLAALVTIARTPCGTTLLDATQADATSACLEPALTLAASSSEAEVRRAVGGTIDALLTIEARSAVDTTHATCSVRKWVAPLVAGLVGDEHDEATRAAAHRAATRLAAGDAGWAALREHRPDWFERLWSELCIDEPSDDLALAALHALCEVLRGKPLRLAAMNAWRSIERHGTVLPSAESCTGVEPLPDLDVCDGLVALCSAPTAEVALAALEVLEAAIMAGAADAAAMACEDNFNVRSCIDAAAQHTDARVRRVANRVACAAAGQNAPGVLLAYDNLEDQCTDALEPDALRSFFGPNAATRLHECE